MKKLKTSHILITAFIVIVSLLFISTYLKDNNVSNLKENGIVTLAIISKIDANNYRANEMDGSKIENYIFTFNFSVNEEKIKSIRTVEKKNFSKFFSKELFVNDTISILYDPSNPRNNKIKELTTVE
ncbi:MAG: hypothetical protein V3V28_03365 [Polaribacter sp.]|uniref:hypothetical protein n=1 Tax=Polaribacter sp. TaxID=1920175 RepID=UPI002F3570BD